jgi:hypothetical protein
MKLTERIIDITSLAISPEQEAPRTEGCHVSSIIRYLKSGLDGGGKNNFTQDDLENFAIVGRLFETVLAQGMFRPPRYVRIGEIVCDDIIGSPDAYDVEEGAVLEFKATWVSSKRDILSIRHYWWQLLAYAKMLETQKAVLVAFYVNGDYTNRVPQMKAWDVFFTQDEIEQNWQMLVRNKEMAQ